MGTQPTIRLQYARMSCRLRDATLGPWSSCSKTCGTGTKQRVRAVARPSAHGGASCDVNQESTSCKDNNCPIHCVMNPWSSWSACTKTCGGGSQTHTRTVKIAPVNGGTQCPFTTETQACNSRPCMVDCQLSAWGSWSSCSASCGTGSHHRSRSVEVAAAHGGKGCDPLLQSIMQHAHVPD